MSRPNKQHMGLDERRKYLDEKWMVTYKTTAVFQRQVEVTAQTLALLNNSTITLGVLDDAFMAVAELWEAEVALMHEGNVCPFDCDGCHGDDCPCPRLGCAGDDG